MANYVDGFVIAIPKKNLAAYRRMAKIGAKMWKKYGALDYMECVLDDARPKWVTFTYAKMLKLKPSETAIFSYITYKSRAHRDKVNAKVMSDPEMDPSNNKDTKLPFDMKRMAMAGFKVMVER